MKRRVSRHDFGRPNRPCVLVPDSDCPDFDGPDFDCPDFDFPDFDGPDLDCPDFDGPVFTMAPPKVQTE